MVKQIIFLLVAFFFLGNGQLFAQQCDWNELDAKYQLYKQRFYKHFIVEDRTKEGCVNDGIGFQLSKDSTSGSFSKEGYGLPATGFYLSANGAGVPGRRLNSRLDRDCANYGISWFNLDEDVRKKPNHRFNWLDYGSETLSELGWLFVALATEYELLGREGDEKGQQRILEDIFLSLQAIRRLDMLTEYILDRAYAKRGINGDPICTPELVNATSFGWWNNCHRTWGVKVKQGANYHPDYSGYSGFFIRCDASQKLAPILDDSTNESWNVDAIGGAYGALGAVPSGSCPPIDTMCFLVNEQHFLSQDQILSLFYGFLYLKKYIPEDKFVKTCDGVIYYPLKMMQKISAAMIARVESNHLVLPGSKENCGKHIKLSECEGGNLLATIFALRKANEIIQGEAGEQSTFWQRNAFGAMGKAKGGFNYEFYFKLSSEFRDLGEMKKRKRKKMLKLSKQLHKEILILGNDLLFPAGKSLAEDLGGQVFFDSLLCMAPLGGPCHILYEKDSIRASFEPHGFECDNVPGWESSRWEEPNWTKNGQLKSWCPSRRSNGVDYMVLYNMYRLMYDPRVYKKITSVAP